MWLFLGSCTNGRLSDLQEVAQFIKGKKVADTVKAIVVPGSQVVASIASAQGLDAIFEEAGFEWRGAGCSMCLAMNPDKLVGNRSVPALQIEILKVGRKSYRKNFTDEPDYCRCCGHHWGGV